MPPPRILAIVLFVIVLAPLPSRADGLIVPYFGANGSEVGTGHLDFTRASAGLVFRF